MGITHSFTTVINSTATATSYTGSLTVASASNTLLVFLTGYKSTVGDVPSTIPLVVTYGGQSMTLVRESNSTSVQDWCAVYRLDAPPTGANTLSVSGVSFRCLVAEADEVAGANAAAPIAAHDHVRSTFNITSLSFSRTTAANGNHLVSAIVLRSPSSTPDPVAVAAELATTGGATLVHPVGTGTNGFNDHAAAVAWEEVATAGADGHGYTWTSSVRADLIWVELAVGSSDITDAVTPASIAITGQAVGSTISGGDITDAVTPASIAIAGQLVGSSVSGVSQPLSIAALPSNRYIFDSADGVSTTVTLTGLGTTGDDVQVRAASTGGNSAWVSTTVALDGTWSVSFDLALSFSDGKWLTPEARIGTDDLTKVAGTTEFGCGHILGKLGQSELEYILNTTASFYSQITYPALAAENITVWTQATSGGAITRRSPTEATKTQTNVAMIALANALHHVKPGRKFMILDLAEVGTSRAGLMNDGDDGSGGRKWSDLADMVALVRSGGSDVGHIVECWYNSDAATLQDFRAEWMPFYIGERSGGGAFTLGTANPDSTRNPGKLVDHCLWDITAAPGAQGRGLFARARTKYHMLAPMVFHDTSTSTEQANFSDATNRILDLDRPARDEIRAFFDDARVQTFGGSWGPSMHVVDFGAGTHPEVTDPWGVAQFGRSFFPAYARAAGVTVGEPEIIGTFTAFDGSYADIIVDLPNGGTLTTPRLLNAMAAPGVEPPHWQEAIGFEIRRAADSDAQRRPVFKPSETSYPAAYRGTVTIVDAGSGTVPSRQGRVRIVPDTPFATGDRIEFLRGEANGALLEPRDTNARLFLDMLIEHVPAFYDAGTLYPYQGVPVRPQPAVQTLTRSSGQVTQVLPASIAIAGQQVGVTITVPVTPASIAIAGQTVGVTISDSVQPASIALTGQSVGSTISGGDITDAVTPASIAITGQLVGSTISGGGLSARRIATEAESRNGVTISRG